MLLMRAGTQWSELLWELLSISGDQLRSVCPSPM